jgi:NADH dehydrogenase/NADH:ubiquinone oxidoreductase subunit G
MCDEGMLTYKQAHDGRIVHPRLRGADVPFATAVDEVKSLFASAPKEAVAFVLSAGHSTEDNWMLSEIATTLFGSRALYAGGAPAGYEDTILIHRDKNSNTEGVKQLAPSAKSLDVLANDIAEGRVTHVIALGSGAVADPKVLGQASLVTIAAHKCALADAATVVLPATSWAEQSGTYTNAKGIRQVSEKALEPLGASRPAWRQLADVATALGYEVPAKTLKQIRTQLVGGPAPEPYPSTSALASAE